MLAKFLCLISLATFINCQIVPLSQEELDFYAKQQLIKDYQAIHDLNVSITNLGKNIDHQSNQFRRRRLLDGGSSDTLNQMDSTPLLPEDVGTDFAVNANGALFATSDQVLLTQILESRIHYQNQQKMLRYLQDELAKRSSQLLHDMLN